MALIVRVSTGLLLVTAAIAKVNGDFLTPYTGFWEPFRFLQFAYVVCELALGAWLLTNLYPSRARLAAMMLFIGLSLISLANWISDVTVCNCFGAMAIHPSSSLSIDLTVLALLVGFPVTAESPQRLGQCGGVIRRGIFTVALFGCAIAVPVVYMLQSEAGDRRHEQVVDLTPSAWAGKRLPIISDIEIPSDLTSGEWIVLLYRHDCSACRAAVDEYAQLSADLSANPVAPRIAIVEVPPLGFQPVCPKLCYGHLTSRNRWSLKHAAALLIHDGIVQTVFSNAYDVDLLRRIWMPPDTSAADRRLPSIARGSRLTNHSEVASNG